MKAFNHSLSIFYLSLIIHKLQSLFKYSTFKLDAFGKMGLIKFASQIADGGLITLQANDCNVTDK